MSSVKKFLQLGHKLVWYACIVTCGIVCRNLGFTLKASSGFIEVLPSQLYPIDQWRGNWWWSARLGSGCHGLVSLSIQCECQHFAVLLPVLEKWHNFHFVHPMHEVIVSDQVFSVSEFCYFWNQLIDCAYCLTLKIIKNY